MKEQSKSELAAVALADKAFFSQYILGFDCPNHQAGWYRSFEQAKKEGKWLMILSPCAHGKSKSLSVTVPIHELVKDRNLRVGIISAQDDLSQDIMREIEAHLSSNPYLIENFGPFKPENPRKWSMTGNPASLDIINDGVHLKDSSLTAAGAGTSILGRRFDLLILDDFLDDKNTRTSARRKAILKWFFGVLRSRLEPGAMVVVIGTRQHAKDLYSVLMKDPRFICIVQSAIIDEFTKETLWPEKWPYEELAKLREQDPVTFEQFYQNNLLPEFSVLSTSAKIRDCFDYSRTLIPSLSPEQRASFDKVVVGVDPNIITSRRSKYAVIFVMGVKEPKHFVLQVIRERCYSATLKNHLRAINQGFSPNQFYIESNAFQNYLVQEVREYIPTRGLFTSAKKNDAAIG